MTKGVRNGFCHYGAAAQSSLLVISNENKKQAQREKAEAPPLPSPLDSVRHGDRRRLSTIHEVPPIVLSRTRSTSWEQKEH